MQATITRQNDRLIIKTPFELKDTVKALPGRLWDKPRRVWTVPATVRSAGEARAAFAQIEVRADRATLELMAAAEDAAAAQGAKDATDLPDFPGKTAGWMHQRQAFHFAVKQEGAMLALDMGTGKSKVLIGLCEAHGADTAIILAPPKATKVWPTQFQTHAEREWIVCNHGGYRRDGKLRPKPTVAQRVEAAEAALHLGERTNRPVAIVVNYEAAWQGAMRPFLLGRSWGVGALDEGHKVKAPGGAWSKFCTLLRDRCSRRYDLTGTPMPHSAPDIYAQARFLDPGVFGTSYRAFVDRYFEHGGFEDREIVGFKDAFTEVAFTQRLASLTYFCDSEDVLDLPPVNDLPPLTCTLGAEAKRAYAELESDFVTFVAGADEDDPVVASNALAKLLRLAQVTSGHLPVENEETGRRIHVLGDEKARLLEDTLEDMPRDEPVVVFGRFRHDLDVIRRAVENTGRTYGEISGAREDGLARGEDGAVLSTMSPDVDVVGVQLQAGGVGIDLTRARYAIYYSMDFNLGDYWQSRKRVHRPGQERETFYIYLVAEGTVDEVIRQALDNREDVVRAVVRAARGGSI